MLAGAVLCLLAQAAVAGEAESIRSAMRHAVLAAESATSGRHGQADLQEAAERFYAPGDFAPVWLDGKTPRRQALQVLEILQEAASHGLDPADYDAAGLAQRLRDIGIAEGVTPQDIAQTEVGLSLALFRWLSDVSVGRINPRVLHASIDRPQKQPDLPKLVREALASDRLPEAAAAAAPRFQTYARLREVLARYRALAGERATGDLPPLRKLEPGMPYAGLERLRDLLVALGDLPAGTVLPARYEGQLADGVMRFQGRHGLAADGVVGRRTFEQLNAPLKQRVRQIELALERLRWLPSLQAGKVVGINIPEFRLRGFEVRDGTATVRLAMNIIVGRALNMQTPVFTENMRYVEFNPYWNVPSSIARKELVPKLRRDPASLDSEDMEFVSTGRDRRITTEADPENLDALLRGDLRLRQRPGLKNALGKIKFVLPNNMDVYLHDTPAPQLFRLSRRDFSHGCIRVEEPVELAKFVLEGQAEGSEERIRAAIAAGTTATVRLARPVPVVVFYTTALVEEGGRILFLPDIYGHDQALDQALKDRYASPR